MTNNPGGSDVAPENAELSLVSNLSVGLPGTQPEAITPAEQGDAPADRAEQTWQSARPRLCPPPPVRV